jgi:hypothetical protein
VRIYCGCKEAGTEFHTTEDGGLIAVTLDHPMTTEKIGVEQRLAANGARHYPNVDVRACNHCKRRVVVE